MHSEAGVLILIFVSLALIIGAGVRSLVKSIQLPYTVCLLTIGLCLGYLERIGITEQYAPLLDKTLALVAGVDPHLILFLFLPTLVFESAFSLEVHLFRRIFAQIALLAVPGLVIATTLTASLAKWMFPWDWSWALCLMFGALISATDPVAVVALLKEVSSRKRLETLLEGESLLNDGTAIVLFTLFFGWVISSQASQQISLVSLTANFTWVVTAGLLVGVVAGGLVMIWIGKVFNDPLIEITLSIATAYLVYYIAESLHVSGIVAVVALALMFAGIGRTRISPEVGEFLHNFWGMMAHMANTLIFLLVGILIASRVHWDNPESWVTLGILYIGIQIIRTFSVFILTPLLKRFSGGITREKAIVLTWGGLRGAVSLALALIVAQENLLPKEIGDQVLFLCAGIVVLSIVINGSTMSWILARLHLNQLPAAKQATVDKAQRLITEDLLKLLPKLMGNSFLKGADWDEVKHNTGLLRPIEVKDKDHEPNQVSSQELTIAFRRRLLETERQHYWLQFEKGTLGKQSTNKLVEAVEHALDGEPKIAPRETLYRYWQTPPLLHLLRNIRGIKKIAVSLSFSRITLGYEIARGFIQAQDHLESYIPSLAPNEEEAAAVKQLIAQNKLKTQEYIEQLRNTFPDLVHTLETHSAIRTLLNRERTVVKQLLNQAVLDKPEAKRLVQNIEQRMARLQRVATFAKPTSPEELLSQLNWCKNLAVETQQQLIKIIEHTLYSSGEWIIHQGKPFYGLGIIAKGSIEAYEYHLGKKFRKTLGPGELVGTLSLLSGVSPGDYQAMSLVNMLWLPGEKLKQLMAKDSALAEAIGELLQPAYNS
ncbi:cation:proton antiporter [Zooshikella ganghwensis]|uniref:Peptidase n=1 Tax=Zooshikella ganghwensis TaxID=202772 RepID=A0A4V1INN1_9GAMM|nr:cation:proton antiporter [Zooshikella ganghwensis]RDH44311.1 peptidase [Zooshikella ganghwensis]